MVASQRKKEGGAVHKAVELVRDWLEWRGYEMVADSYWMSVSERLKRASGKTSIEGYDRSKLVQAHNADDADLARVPQK